MTAPVLMRLELSNCYGLADSEAKFKVLVSVSGAVGAEAEQLPLNVTLVVDRSTSMTGAALDRVKEAAKQFVDGLTARDRLSVVAFGSDVEVLVESTAVEDVDAIKTRIDRLRARGATNVHEALSVAVDETKKGQTDQQISRMILISDGEATEGIIDDEAILSIVAAAHQKGITVSTLGVGEDYDEVLLSDIAQASRGNHYYLADASTTVDILTTEFKRIRSICARNVVATLSLASRVKVRQANLRYSFERRERGGTIVFDTVEVGREQQAMFELEIEPRPTGEYRLGTVELSYDALSSGEKGECSSPIMVTFVTDGKTIRDGINRDVLRKWEELNALQELKTLVEMLRDNAIDAKTAVYEIDSKAQVLIKRKSLDLARTFADVGKTIAEAGAVSTELVKRTIVACQDKQQGGDGTLVE